MNQVRSKIQCKRPPSFICNLNHSCKWVEGVPPKVLIAQLVGNLSSLQNNFQIAMKKNMEIWITTTISLATSLLLAVWLLLKIHQDSLLTAQQYKVQYIILMMGIEIEIQICMGINHLSKLWGEEQARLLQLFRHSIISQVFFKKSQNQVL